MDDKQAPHLLDAETILGAISKQLGLPPDTVARCVRAIVEDLLRKRSIPIIGVRRRPPFVMDEEEPRQPENTGEPVNCDVPKIGPYTPEEIALADELRRLYDRELTWEQTAREVMRLLQTVGKNECQEKAIRPTYEDRCPKCGYPYVVGIDDYVHIRCDGTGRKIASSEWHSGKLVRRSYDDCPGCCRCKPLPLPIKKTKCKTCNGAGEIRREERWSDTPGSTYYKFCPDCQPTKGSSKEK